MIDEDGVSLVELLIATLVASVAMGAALGMAAAVQQAYAYELEDAAVQHDARFALDRIADAIATAGTNPYDIGGAVDPAAGCAEAIPGLELDPNRDGVPDDVRVLADVTRPDGLLGGAAATCDTAGEDVTFAHDRSARTITRLDAALDVGPAELTDAVVTGLHVGWLDASRVRVTLAVQSWARNPVTGTFATYTYVADVRVRAAP
jgi:Tfp pilus assembly protein PilW